MKKIILLFVSVCIIGACAQIKEKEVLQVKECPGAVTLANEAMSVSIAPDGSLASLRNLNTGHDYAGGALLWRLYYDAPYEKEIQI